MNRWIVSALLIVGLVLPAVARAHGAHVHKVLGTVSAVDGNLVTVKTTDGKTVMVMLDAKTKITQGKTTLNSTALKAGARIIAEGTEKEGTVTAATVRIGSAPVPAAR